MNLHDFNQCAGPSLVLRLVQLDDAAYLLDLRMNPVYNTHLSQVSGTVADQRDWIKAYKQREAQGDEFYYIITRHDGTRCGTVRIYDITDDSFAWGSWILDQAKPHRAALESAVLSFDIGFRLLDRGMARIDVRKDNTHAAAFYLRLGMIETHRTEHDIYFTYARTRYQADRAAHLEILQKAVPV